MILQGRRILLAVSGGIAAYKIPFLVRLLRQSGAEVRVAMTPAAEEFVTPLTLAALSGSEVERHLVKHTSGRAAWNNHVHLAEWAEALVVAPATCNTIAKAANGLCDNLVLSLVLSAKCPIFWAPAMDLDMYAYPATQHNLNRLQSMGHIVWPSPDGELASGLSGAGRMSEPAFMHRALELHFGSRSFWVGKRILLTSGATEELIDPVRFITNGSSGKMGEAIAAEAESRGAEVVWLRGPMRRADRLWSNNVRIIPVRSASEMHDMALAEFGSANIAIAAAAVADMRPASVRNDKSSKSELMNGIELVPTEDVLRALGGQRRPDQVLVGFALETHDGLDSARKKLASKGANVMVLNYATAQTGMESDNNQIALVTANDIEEGPLETKAEAARRILDWVERFVAKA